MEHFSKKHKEKEKGISHPLHPVDASLRELVSLGNQCLSRRDWGNAEKYLLEAHCIQPDDGNIHELLAHARYQNFLQESVSKQKKYTPTRSSPLHDLTSKSGIKMHITNLVFQGGGIKGIAYIGAMEEFQHCVDLKSIVRVGGTSAGAIATLLFGLGFTVEEAGEKLKKVDWSLLMDGEFAKSFLEMQEHKTDISSTLTKKVKSVKQKGKMGWISLITSFLIGKSAPYSKEFRLGLTILSQQLGLFPGDFFREAMAEKVVQQKTGIPYLTFLELHELKESQPEKCFRDIYFVATNLSTQEIKIFSWETTPNAIISDALRCSMSIPFVFTPHQQHNKINGRRIPDESEHLFVDGSVLENYPIWIFDKAKFLPDRPSHLHPDTSVSNPYTLGFKLVNRETTALFDACHPFITGTEKIKDLPSFLSKLFMVVAFREESEHFIKPHDQLRTVYIYDLGIQGTEFALDQSKLENLIENGRKAFEVFVKKRVLEHGTQRMQELSAFPQKQPRFVYSVFTSYDVTQAMEILNRSGILLGEVDELGNTAMHVCALLDDEKTCKKLLEAGLDPTTPNQAGKTPSDVAKVFHSKDVSKLLRSFITEHKHTK